METDALLDRMIGYLIKERGIAVTTPARGQAAFRLWRALVNTRPPLPADDSYLDDEDEYLRRLLEGRGIASVDEAQEHGGLYLWKGDITRLAADGIVNAANSAMLGCFRPYHGCIDNAIHTFAGVRLRLACSDIMRGRQAAPGGAVVTPAFCLPSRYVIHTVGPIVTDEPSDDDEQTLSSCYSSVLSEALGLGLSSLAFCCISTGEFGYPKREAAGVAVRTVRKWLRDSGSGMKIIFDVFGDEDLAIYREILG